MTEEVLYFVLTTRDFKMVQPRWRCIKLRLEAPANLKMSSTQGIALGFGLIKNNTTIFMIPALSKTNRLANTELELINEKK